MRVLLKSESIRATASAAVSLSTELGERLSDARPYKVASIVAGAPVRVIFSRSTAASVSGAPSSDGW